MKTKEKVEYILKNYEFSRNCDNYLIVKLWKEYYELNLITLMNVNKTDLSEFSKELWEFMQNVPKTDDIIRWRRKFNQKGLYLATSNDVLLKRKQKEIDTRKELGYNPEMVTGDKWPKEWPSFISGTH